MHETWIYSSSVHFPYGWWSRGYGAHIQHHLLLITTVSQYPVMVKSHRRHYVTSPAGERLIQWHSHPSLARVISHDSVQPNPKFIITKITPWSTSRIHICISLNTTRESVTLVCLRRQPSPGRPPITHLSLKPFRYPFSSVPFSLHLSPC